MNTLTPAHFDGCTDADLEHEAGYLVASVDDALDRIIALRREQQRRINAAKGTPVTVLAMAMTADSQ